MLMWPGSYSRNHALVTKQSWRSAIKLSSIIDNLDSASSAEKSVDVVTQHNNQQAQRKAAMAVLAHAEAGEIAARLGALALPAHQDLRAPENGLVMLRGRVGGDGAPFSLGEATVSRAAVRLASGEVGFGYTLGRDGEKARLIALCDALVQSSDFGGAVERDIIAPLREQLMAKRKQVAAETAATKVDFYTMVRGEG
jgi:alpha-D-ribose 1-methylphosphonate 5-triphosphate synthase subunit PhnG